MNSLNFELTKQDVFPILIEHLEVAKEILSNKDQWKGFEENIEYAREVLVSYYKGMSIHHVVSLPLHY